MSTTKPDETCAVCSRSPRRMNSERAECSHVDCPHRRHCWSERPRPADLFRGPWPKNVESDPVPLDRPQP
jgi:hypothetical protein